MTDAIVASIAARCSIVSLRMSSWCASHAHQPETTAVNLAHHTRDSARVTVRLSAHPALSELRAHHAAVRAEHVRLTAPSISDDMRLLPHARQMQWEEVAYRARRKHDDIVQRFLIDYPAERASAPARLNGLYLAGAWPSDEAIVTKFGCASRILPCPTDGAWREWIAESAEVASRDLRDRLTDALAALADRCSANGKLHAQRFVDLREICQLAPDLDLARDPRIAAALAAIDASPLASVTVDSAREDASVRATTAYDANRIVDMLGGVRL